ncbi:MAG: class I SAM-dependent rRNA methyltransferase [Candidatus Sumerlaeaceae bacterium]|nr:class I SAM-dependent rRNA methyltransferase [Candidatus Sumerlaeaceae bacterium]
MTRKPLEQPWWKRFSKRNPKARRQAGNKNNANAVSPKQPAPEPDKAVGEAAGQDESHEAPPASQHLPPAVKHCRLPALTVQGRKSPQGSQIPVWIYDTLVEQIYGNVADGETVAIFSKAGKFLGSAVYNSHSKIRARLFSYDLREFDDDYIEHAIIAAWNRRRMHYPIKESFRVVYSEADALPGLIVDKLADVLVIQFLTLAVERHADCIVRTLKALFSPAAVVIRRDAPMRAREGLEVSEAEVLGNVSLPLAVELDGVTYLCDPIHGQKTGLYLDQRFNRRLLAPYARGKSVLDLFCHVGGWALAAAKAGAASVLGVDSASPALELARQAAADYGWTNVEFVESDVFDFLEQKRQESATYDVIICDPPAFAKSQRHLPEAERAYLSLNYRAMKLLPVAGILVTCSCSQHLSEEQFILILETAARNARIRFQLIERGGQPPDHPELLGLPESRYLKCLFLRRME